MRLMDRYRNAVISVLAIVLGLLGGAVLMLVNGNNPIEGYKYLFLGGLMSPRRIGTSLALASTLTLTGLSLAFAGRTGLFNIGAPGQMLMGGFLASAFALSFDFGRALMLPLVIIIAMLGGALWALIPGFLKARFNVNEVVSTIMMNWIAYWSVQYFVYTYFNESESVRTATRHVRASASLRMEWLSNLFDGSSINLGFILAIACVALVAFILNRTVLGYELKAVGFNRYAAEYAGINVSRGIILSMVISGALAGLAGATHYCGYSTNLQAGVLPSQGYDGIAVALLGLNTPSGSALAALFLGIIQSGKNFMKTQANIEPELADTIIAIIIYFAATSLMFQRIIDWFRKRGAGKPGERLMEPRETGIPRGENGGM